MKKSFITSGPRESYPVSLEYAVSHFLPLRQFFTQGLTPGSNLGCLYFQQMSKISVNLRYLR